MALDSVLVPCGFEESLVAFDSCVVLNANESQDWSASEIDYSDTLGELGRENIGTERTSSSSETAMGKTWCRSRQGARRSSSSNTPSPRRPFLLWSPHLRLRDERKRVLKISLAKLRHIDDPESCLRRSVLLSNTLRGLQREARQEKIVFRSQNREDSRVSGPRSCSPGPTLKNPDTLGNRSSSSLSSSPSSTPGNGTPSLPDSETSSPRVKRRKSSELMEDVEMASVDSSDEKKGRPALRPCNTAYSSSSDSSPVSDTSSSMSFSFLSSGLSGVVSPFETDKQYSCGHSSLFGELESVVFHSLITSLES